MNAEQAAEAARRTLGLGSDGPIPDLLRLLEDEAGLFVFIVGLSDQGVDGGYQVADGDPFVIVNQDKSPVRKRFTLAHEFGHHYLAHGAQFDQRISFRDNSETERDANAFAAALLAPRQAIDQWFARRDDPKVDLKILVRVAASFNVSAFVIRYRLENENRISAALGKRFDEAIRARQHLKVEAELGLKRPLDTISTQHAQGGYVPAAMQAKIADLLRRDLLSEEAAAALLRISDEAASVQIREMLAPDGVSPGGVE